MYLRHFIRLLPHILFFISWKPGCFFSRIHTTLPVSAVGLSLVCTDISCAVRDEWMTYIILLVYRSQCRDMAKALISFFLKDWLTTIFLSIAHLIISTLRHFRLPPKTAEVLVFCSFYLRYNRETSSPAPHQNEPRRKKILLLLSHRFRCMSVPASVHYADRKVTFLKTFNPLNTELNPICQ